MYVLCLFVFFFFRVGNFWKELDRDREKVYLNTLVSYVRQMSQIDNLISLCVQCVCCFYFHVQLGGAHLKFF